MKKIIAGEFWKTRDGRKTFVSSVDTSTTGDLAFPVNGIILGNVCSDCWELSGAFEEEGKESPEDLVEPWPKKKKQSSDKQPEFKKPVYQWDSWHAVSKQWSVHLFLMTKDEAAIYFNFGSIHYRIHSGPYEGEAP